MVACRPFLAFMPMLHKQISLVSNHSHLRQFFINPLLLLLPRLLTNRPTRPISHLPLLPKRRRSPRRRKLSSPIIPKRRKRYFSSMENPLTISETRQRLAETYKPRSTSSPKGTCRKMAKRSTLTKVLAAWLRNMTKRNPKRTNYGVCLKNMTPCPARCMTRPL